MSRLAKKPIAIPEKTDVTFAGGVLTVKGPLGTLSKTIRPYVTVAVDAAAKTVTLTPVDGSIAARAMVGTYVAHLKNMIAGVHKPYEKKLVVEGIGYKADIKGKDLVLALGFSHPITMPIPADLTVKSEKSQVTVSGIDAEKVGQFAADIRAHKKPEPYLGKGVRYIDEVVRRKQGKKAA
jgi:large subunit ribosomal protein L6